MKAGAGRFAADDILHRKKRGFGTPMGAWLKRELAPLLRAAVAPRWCARGLFAAGVDPPGGRPRGQPHRRHRRLLALMNLEIWSRIYLDHRAPDDVAARTEKLRAHEHPLRLPPFSRSRPSAAARSGRST
jgi:asparagine synthase (glutamine-hydrolysing)